MVYFNMVEFIFIKDVNIKLIINAILNDNSSSCPSHNANSRLNTLVSLNKPNY